MPDCKVLVEVGDRGNLRCLTARAEGLDNFAHEAFRLGDMWRVCRYGFVRMHPGNAADKNRCFQYGRNADGSSLGYCAAQYDPRSATCATHNGDSAESSQFRSR